MKTLRVRVLSAATAIALLAGTMGIASLSSLASAAVVPVITQPATSVTSTDATLNATNGFDAATGSSFWVSTSTFSTASPTIPSGVYSTVDLGAQASSSPFSAQLSSATGLPPVTPNTTYYFAAWVNVDGVWQPGEILTLTTLPSAPTVSGVSPTSGPTTGGTVVTVTGTNLTGASAVMFGSTPATGVVVASSTSLTAVSPAGSAGTVDITVTTPGGTSATSSADHFTYVAPSLTPAISNIAVSGISSTTATVTWTTDVPATGQVSYGTTTSYGSNGAFNGTASTTHSALLSGLSEGTLYHFAVKSGNVVGTTTSSDHTFVTQSTSSSTPLHVDSVTAVQTSATADGLFSDGWVWVMHLTVPDNEDAFRMSFTDWTGSAGTFQADNNVRISSAQSSNASTPSSGIISPNNNYGDWMYLTGDTSTTTPGRQIDVEIDVRIPVGTNPGSYSTTYNANSVPQTATSTAI